MIDPELYQAQVTMLFNSLQNAFEGLRDMKESKKKDQEFILINRIFANEIEIKMNGTYISEIPDASYYIHEDFKSQLITVNSPQSGLKFFKFDLNSHKWQSVTKDVELKQFLKDELSII